MYIFHMQFLLCAIGLRCIAFFDLGYHDWSGQCCSVGEAERVVLTDLLAPWPCARAYKRVSIMAWTLRNGLVHV